MLFLLLLQNLNFSVVKKVFFIVSFLALIAPGLLAEVGPQIKITPEEWDLGEIAEDKVKEKIFIVENSGDQDLIIESIFTGCGCTETEISAYEIAPNQEEELKVTYNPKGKNPGEDQGDVFIFSNDPLKPKTEISIRAQIIPDK